MDYSLQAVCCSYLKQRCDFKHSHYKNNIRQIYKRVLESLLDEKKPIAQYRIDEENKQMPQINQLTYIFSLLDFQVRITTYFLCSKTYNSSKDSIHQMFRCQQCGLEEGSVSCVDCFKVEDHQNHQFELVKIPGGCCDCGDYTKWKKESTCKIHKVIGQLENQPDQIDVETFQTKCNHFLQIFCRLYEAYKARKAQILQLQSNQIMNRTQLQRQKQAIKYIQNLVDTFGSYFLTTLVKINNNHFLFNKHTRRWMQKHLPVPDSPSNRDSSIYQRPIMYMLMRFIQMKRTGKVCSELYVILFNRCDEEWARNTTKQYFTVSKLPYFFSSAFSQYFTPQILSCSQLIKDLIDSWQIQPLTFKIELGDNPSQQELDKYYEQYKNFFINLDYLFDMKQAAFRTYWLRFTKNCGFQDLITYEQMFNRSDFHLRLGHKKYFYLEELALKRIVKIIDKMNGDQIFIVDNLTKLTRKLFILYQCNQNEQKQPNNLFFTYERIWTIFLFAYFYFYQQKNSCNELSIAEIDELLHRIYFFQQAPQNNKLKLESFMRVLHRLMRQLIRSFFNIGHVMKSNSNYKQHLELVRSYFLSNNLIYSIDSFMLVILLQISKAYNAELDKTLKNLLDQYLSKLDSEFAVAALHTFVFLILEPIYFKYQDLILLAHFKQLSKNDRFQAQFIDFYRIIYNAWCQKENRDTLPEFKDSFQQLFFAEDYFFHQFITDNLPKLGGQEQPIFNIQYFYALKHKIGRYMIKQSFGYIPQSLRRSLGLQIPFSGILLMMKKWIKKLGELDNNKKSKDRINQLAKQYQKIARMTGQLKYLQYIDYPQQEQVQKNKNSAKLDQYKHQKCMFLNKCQNRQQKRLYQMGFINITNLLGVFQTDKYDRYLCFSTCGHLVHKQCYENQTNKQKSSILECQRCNRVYNFIISPQQNQPNIELIRQDFQRITSFLNQYSSDKHVQLQIVKAMMAFFIINITIDDFNELRRNMLIYRNLFAKLKYWCKMQTCDLIQKPIKLRSKMNHNLVEFIWCSIVCFGENIDYDTYIRSYKRFSGQTDYILHILRFFNSRSKKWQIKQPSSYLMETDTNINLEQFPASLFELNQKKRCIICKSKTKHSYYICLSHNLNHIVDSPYCVCFQDLKKWVIQHLTGYSYHLNECSMIRTDTGQIHLFHVVNNNNMIQIWERVQPSVYLNVRKNSYQFDKKYDLNDFTRDAFRVKKTINSIRAWNTVLKIQKMQ